MRIAYLITLLSISITAIGQSADTDVILTSMKAELNRNMKELSIEGYEKPFYIGYGVSDIKTLNVSASRGGLIASSVDSSKSWYARVMVGDYTISDENYQDQKLNFDQEFSYENLPLDNNPDGIRRSLWISTNNIYKSAAKLHKSKIQLLKQNNIDSLPLADFSKEPVQSIYAPKQFEFDPLSQYEKMIMDLSSSLNNAPSFRSETSLSLLAANHYFVNSEGTSVVTPYELSQLSMVTQRLDNEGRFVGARLVYMNNAKEALPEVSDINADITRVNKELNKQIEREPFSDLYYGPVLIEGELASDFLTAQLFGSRNASIFPDRQNLVNSDEANIRSFIENQQKQLEKKSQKIGSSNLNIAVYPKLEAFNGQKLIGQTTIDAEGVVPPDTINLVSNGQLIGQLNDRTPTTTTQRSNGHNRLHFNYMSSFKNVAPSNIAFTPTQGKSAEELKEDLIQKAKDLGLTYTLIFRSLKLNADQSNLYECYKVSTETGEEELIRIDRLNLAGNNGLFRISGMSNQLEVHHSLGYGMGTLPMSIICPQSILVDGFEIGGNDNNRQARYEPSIPAPGE